MLGSIVVLPYILELLGPKLAASGRLTMTGPLFFAMQAMQVTLVFGIVVGVGLFVGRKVGICTPWLDRWLYGQARDCNAALAPSIVSGVALGLLTAFGIYGFMAARMPGWPAERSLPIWMRIGAAIYSGIDEELLVRLFLLAIVLWFVRKFARQREHTSVTAFWIANAIVAALFAASYLPTVSMFVPMTSAVVLTIFSVKGISGLVFGYLCWTRGLEMAMLSHFICDLIAHLLGPIVGR